MQLFHIPVTQYTRTDYTISSPDLCIARDATLKHDRTMKLSRLLMPSVHVKRPSTSIQCRWCELQSSSSHQSSPDTNPDPLAGPARHRQNLHPPSFLALGHPGAAQRGGVANHRISRQQCGCGWVSHRAPEARGQSGAHGSTCQGEKTKSSLRCCNYCVTATCVLQQHGLFCPYFALKVFLQSF